MNKLVPDTIEPILQCYLQLMERELPGLMDAFYLHGSVALGAFNPRWSDIDFITVVSRRPARAEIDRLGPIHRQVKRGFPQAALDGSYLPQGDLGRFKEDVEPHPYYNGRLHPQGHHELNPVTGWVLKQRGIAWLGRRRRSWIMRSTGIWSSLIWLRI